MSYIPFRDNPDLAGLPDGAYDRLVPLGELIDDSHARGQHADQCCTDPDCRILRDLRAFPRPSAEEVLGYLIAKGALTWEAVDQLVTGRQPRTPTTRTDSSMVTAEEHRAAVAAALVIACSAVDTLVARLREENARLRDLVIREHTHTTACADGCEAARIEQERQS